MKRISLIISLLLVVHFAIAQINFSELEWKFRQAGQEEWMSAQVPGCVHTDLFANKKIEDPFYRLNETKQLWIETKDWEYQAILSVDKKLLQEDVIELVFDGLDTYADVYLNGECVITANNFFRQWKASVKSILNEGENQIRIYFHSPINFVMPKYNSLPYHLPHSNDQSEIQVAPLVRKPGYHFGWDWGPRFVTSGIWNEARLKAWSSVKFENVWIRQQKLSTDQALLNVQMEVQATKDCQATITINEGVNTGQLKVSLHPGLNTIEIPFVINKPKLWWPNGMGKQNLYELEVEMNVEGKLKKTSKKIGLRTLRFVNQKDDDGYSYYFEVNGIPFFAKGANYIPQDMLLNRVTDDRYRSILESTVDANMNMLRVWGGGLYEKDIFYDLCDELGIVVWQDFMFACGLYPGDKEFVENVKEEAIQNVKRLRNHACLGFWCGNNEVEGFKKYFGNYKKLVKDFPNVGEDYEHLFKEVLPEVVKTYDPANSYVSTSPKTFKEGTTVFDLKYGDYHYWRVWSGGKDFHAYKDNIARFMSEYGFQALPSVETLNDYCAPEDMNCESEVMMARSRWGSFMQHKTGWNKGIPHLNNYINQNYKPATSFSDFVYKSQLLQADAICYAVMQHRKKMPFCMGSLYWQLNDVWPGASWSSLDYKGNWKALHFALKKAFSNLSVFIEPEEKQLEVFVVSDQLKTLAANAEILIYTLDGELVNSIKKSIKIKKQAVTEILNIGYSEILKGKSKQEVFVEVIVEANAKVLSRTTQFLDRAKNLELPSANVKAKIIKKGKQQFIRLTSDKPAFKVLVETDNNKMLKENLVTVLPQKPILILLDKQDNPYSIDKFTVNWLNK